MSVETQVVLGGVVVAIGALLFVVGAERHAVGDGKSDAFRGLMVILAGGVVIVHGMLR
jgi:hypothetical protein